MGRELLVPFSEIMLRFLNSRLKQIGRITPTYRPTIYLCFPYTIFAIFNAFHVQRTFRLEGSKSVYIEQRTYVHRINVAYFSPAFYRHVKFIPFEAYIFLFFFFLTDERRLLICYFFLFLSKNDYGTPRAIKCTDFKRKTGESQKVFRLLPSTDGEKYFNGTTGLKLFYRRSRNSRVHR